MYSITQGGGGPIPTRITLGEGPFKMGAVSGPRPKVKLDSNFGINTESYSGSAAFTIPFTVNADAPEGAASLNTKVRYQVCNDTVCLPPKTVPLAAALTITAAGAAASPTPTSPTPTPSPSATPGTNANSNANSLANTSTNQDSNSNVAVLQSDVLGVGVGLVGVGEAVAPAAVIVNAAESGTVFGGRQSVSLQT